MIRLPLSALLMAPLTLLSPSLPGAVTAQAPAFKKLTVTYDPALVAVKTFQISVELRPVPRWSGSILAGGGGESSYFRQFDGSWTQFGAQARWYPGPPGGIDPHAFVHAVWERVRYDEKAQQTRGDPSRADLGVAAAGWGWKFTHRKGFAFDAQLGLAAFLRKEANASPLEAVGLPYVNLGLGVSFF